MACSDGKGKTYFSSSPEETEQIAALLADTLTGGEVIAFTGGMGMGKTAFTRGLVAALGSKDVVSSPTFALVHEYSGRLTVEHFDMYRVNSWDDLYSTGFFDYLDGNCVLVIEWSENIEAALPEHTIWVRFLPGEKEKERIITIEGKEGLPECSF